MDKYFFGQKNVLSQAKKLESILNLDNTEGAKRRCRNLLVENMKEVYNKYNNRKPPNMKPSEFINLLNKKSIHNCKEYVDKLKQKKRAKKYSPESINQYERDRENEMYGRRQPKLDRRPEVMSIRKERQTHQPQYVEENAANYASFNKNDNGGYYDASGALIKGNMITQNYQSGYEDKNFGRGGDELERRMMERQSQYQGRPTGMGMGLNLNQGPPPEINFRLDGTDSRMDKD